jgi:transcriptional regulator with XRE-family HTH domain
MPSPSQPNPEYVALGRALRRLRETCGLTQVALAERVGIRSQFVSEVERGNRAPLWLTLRAWLSACGATLHDLADAIE